MGSSDSDDSYNKRKKIKKRRSRSPDDDYRRKKSSNKSRRHHRRYSSSSSSLSSTSTNSRKRSRDRDSGRDNDRARNSRRRKSRSYSRERRRSRERKRSKEKRRRSRDRSRERRVSNSSRRRSKDRARSRERKRSRERRRSRSWSIDKQEKIISAKDITPFDLMSKVEQAQARIAERLGEVTKKGVNADAPSGGGSSGGLDGSAASFVDFKPIDSLERQKRIKEIEGDAFVASTFTSSSSKKSTTGDVPNHDSVIFGNFNPGVANGVGKSKVKLNTDIDYIINKKFCGNLDERVEKWMKKLDSMAKKSKNKFS